MRGYENGEILLRLLVHELRIPMRGYESLDHLCPLGTWHVTNPHAGL